MQLYCAEQPVAPSANLAIVRGPLPPARPLQPCPHCAEARALKQCSKSSGLAKRVLPPTVVDEHRPLEQI